MIPFDFEYYRPETIQEAVQTFEDIQKQGKSVLYYSGGTEFITFSRRNHLTADAVIDLKGIPECNVLEVQEEQLVIGSGVTLNHITESNLFPLLGEAVKKVADHTSRNKITIGGNLNSRLIYREGILPLLLSNAMVKLAGSEGETLIPLEEVFQQNLQISQGQFLVQILINKSYLHLQHFSLKKTKSTKVGYPVVSISAIVKDKKLRTAFSGICSYPFRSMEIENILNDSSLPVEDRVQRAVERLPSTIVHDIQASAEYREFVFKNALSETIEALKEAIT
ncbi:FAD binding domain-containing protein [Bacillus sp. UNC438CL73TsuS30]|uniref:FAD binding domain-containing protein n=1 Tax=Bacillus sp. UNC438CL73TsuS30 TaxID=1340434 RepID=UPI0004796A13|nr:FAD binding domain-containing protein [Bacillus sp. UNC438CL73TsuS30]